MGLWLQFFQNISPRKKKALLATVLFSAFLGITLFGEQGTLAYFELQKETNLLKKELSELKRERIKLLQKIYALKHDADYIEFLARKDWGFLQARDVVLQLPTP